MDPFLCELRPVILSSAHNAINPHQDRFLRVYVMTKGVPWVKIGPGPVVPEVTRGGNPVLVGFIDHNPRFIRLGCLAPVLMLRTPRPAQ